MLDPWDAPFDDVMAAMALPPGEDRRTWLRAANRGIAARNVDLLRRCTAVFAVLDGPVDSGTPAEVGFAAALGRPVVGWRSDSRLTGDNEADPVNLQVAYFAALHGGGVHDDLQDALAALGALLSRAGSA